MTSRGAITRQWSRSPSNFGWLEPEPKTCSWWSRNFGFWFHRHRLWGKRIVQWFLVFNGPNRGGAKNF